MKSLLSLCLLWAVASSVIHAQTADDYILQGRAFLAAHDLTNANVRFSSALVLSPVHSTGNVFRAATRLLTIPNLPAGSAFLDRLGVTPTNRTAYDWTADFARDTNGVALAPSNVSAVEISAFLRTNVLAEIVAAGANLAVVTATNFTLTLTSAETGTTEVTVDYGDLLLLRAALRFAEYAIYSANSWNLDAQLTALRAVIAKEAGTAESFLEQHPGLFMFATTNDLAAARQSFSDAVALYLDGSAFIRLRPTNVTRLFNLDSTEVSKEADFRTTLNELNLSLNGPVVMTVRSNLTVALSNHFTGANPPRIFSPQFAGDAIIAGTMPDATFGGLVQGFPSYQMEDFLGNDRAVPFVSHFNVPLRLPNNRVQISLDALEGSFFAVQTSTNLQTWTNLTAAMVSQGSLSFTDSNSIGSPRQFYRAVDMSKAFTVSGTVLDVVTGNPIIGAYVVVSPPSSPFGDFSEVHQNTDANGNFLLVPDAPPYTYSQVNVTAVGYVPVEFFGNYHHLITPIYLATPGYHPPNDNFSQRQPIVGTNVSLIGFNVGATSEIDEPDHSYSGAGQSIWWTWTAPADGAVILEALAGSFDTVLAVYTGDSVANLTEVASDASHASTVNFFVTSGTTYQIAVDGNAFSGLVGNRIVLSLRTVPPLPPRITRQPRSQTVTEDDYAYFDATATGTSPMVYQWRKDGTNLVGETGTVYEIYPVTTNQAGIYTLVVSNAAGFVTTSNATLTVIPIVRPANDPFLSHITIAGATVTVTGSNVNATKESGEPNHAGASGGKSIWWTWTAPANVTVKLDTVGSSFDTLLAVYTGTSVSALTGVASDNQSGGNGTSKLSFNATAGITYQIAVDGYFGASGPVVLNLKESLLDSFNPGADSTCLSIAVQGDGKILVGGGFTTLGEQPRNRIGRLNADGGLDTTFNPGANLGVQSLGVQTDGKILVAGYFSTLAGQARNYLGRLNPSGTLDSAFNPRPDFYVRSVAVQADGMLLVAGDFTSLVVQSRNRVGRLNANGTLDATFDPGANRSCLSIAVQGDGKILVGGGFTTLGGQSRNRLGRLNADGTLDAAFNPGANNYIYTMAVQADGKILVGGGFTTLGGQPRNYLGRLNADGSLDSTFISEPNSNVSSLAVQADAKILVGGDFTALDGQPRNHLARLNNNSPATQSLVLNGPTITWLRGGSSPEVWRTTFEVSTDGVNWSSRGVGSRIAGGWELTGVVVPPGASIRARGYATAGRYNGSGSIVETIIQP